MTFKATIKVGGSVVSTTECGDVTLVTLNRHEIGELLSQPVRGDAQVAAEIADRLDAYQIPERR